MTTPQINCTSCHKSFTPITTASGLHFSKLCKECLLAKEKLKRRELLNKKEEVVIKPKIPKQLAKEKFGVKPKGGKVNIKELDRVFSIFIRQRDSDVVGNIRCISCGAVVYWKKSDNGHYINRKHMATRFDEQNCNAQCRSCNRFDEGNLQGYRRGLLSKIGEKATDLLEIKKHNTVHMTQDEINVLTEYYKQKIKN